MCAVLIMKVFDTEDQNFCLRCAFGFVQLLLTKLFQVFFKQECSNFCFNTDLTFEIRVYKDWDENLRDKTSDTFKNFSSLIKKEVGYVMSYLRYR